MSVARWLLLVVLFALGLVACQAKRAPAPSPARSAAATGSSSAPVASAPLPTRPADAERGRALVEQFECHRCHEQTGLAALPAERHCVRCHQDIEAGKVRAAPAKLAQWKLGLRGVSHVPSLAGLSRFKAEWLHDYLTNPHDLRPALLSTMPRLPLSSEQARDVVAYLRSRDEASAPASAAPADRGDLAAGKSTAIARACPSCHAFEGASGWPEARTTGASSELAPDLRFARERMTAQSLALWLRDPKRVKHDSAMPNLALGEAEIENLTAFVLREPLAPRAVPTPPRLPVLERAVSFAEVEKQVFSVTCRHCHSNTEIAFGDGGPGYDGGFGFTPRKVDLSSHRGISSGMLAADGERRSLFERLPDGTPRLLAVLLARQAEEAGSASKTLRGMPLGLPPLTPEQIQLVESWIAQGHSQ